MEPNKTAIERAFELARSGRYVYLTKIRERLRYEGYFTDTVSGPLLCRQLKDTIKAALRGQHKPVPSDRSEPFRPLIERRADHSSDQP